MANPGVHRGLILASLRLPVMFRFAKGKMNFDQFEQKATIAAYLGPATHGSGAFWSGGSYPSRYERAPVAR